MAPTPLACLYSPGPGIEGGRRGHGLSEEVFDHRAHQTSAVHSAMVGLANPDLQTKCIKIYTQTLLSLLEP